MCLKKISLKRAKCSVKSVLPKKKKKSVLPTVLLGISIRFGLAFKCPPLLACAWHFVIQGVKDYQHKNLTIVLQAKWLPRHPVGGTWAALVWRVVGKSGWQISNLKIYHCNYHPFYFLISALWKRLKNPSILWLCSQKWLQVITLFT